MHHIYEKIYPVNQQAALLAQVERHRRKGRRIVFTNGCFDVVHRGHVEYLQFCRWQGETIIVGLNTDDSVRRIKGAERPINCERDRAAVLAAMHMVDCVVLFAEDTPANLINKIRPDVLIKGEDWADRGVAGAETVESYGGKVLFAPLVAGLSSTAVIERFK
ncbi:MAG TPA: D-glycero-beta-D-manno-heptose 1-phosphate adenylyltransferase [Sedimentisphaerales bacterium]|nr:D-glycero-beta-D-manno-heptose 1-phosphate adenylyltransferase [Sedimentisphaerales bacterium]